MIVGDKFIPSNRSRDMKLWICRRLMDRLHLYREQTIWYKTFRTPESFADIRFDQFDTDKLGKSVEYTVPASLYEKLTEGIEEKAINDCSLFLLTKIYEDAKLMSGEQNPQIGSGTIPLLPDDPKENLRLYTREIYLQNQKNFPPRAQVIIVEPKASDLALTPLQDLMDQE